MTEHDKTSHCPRRGSDGPQVESDQTNTQPPYHPDSLSGEPYRRSVAEDHEPVSAPAQEPDQESSKPGTSNASGPTRQSAPRAAADPGQSQFSEDQQRPPTTTLSSTDTTAFLPEQTEPEANDAGGLGDPLPDPILSLPPITAHVGGYPLSARTGEPKRPGVVIGGFVAFQLAAAIAAASYWWYWWVAINIENFGTSSRLIEMFAPRPGSGKSVVLVCVMAVIGIIMTAMPAAAGYNAWHGASLSRVVSIVSCLTSLLAFFMNPGSWLVLVFCLVGTVLIWLPPAKAYFSACQEFFNPARKPVAPPTDVPYGPAPRFQ